MNLSTLRANVDGTKFDHLNSGCPINSACNKNLGTKRISWIKFLRSTTAKTKKIEFDNFTKKFGVPINIWTTLKAAKDQSIIQWDSPCRGHRIPGKEIFKGQVFVKSFHHIEKQESLIVPKIYLLNKEQLLKVYPRPRDTFPSFMTNKTFFYNLSDEGELFGIKVSKSGTIDLNRSKFSDQSPREVKCPNQLVSLFEERKRPQNLFQGHYCKAIWNLQKKQYQTVLLGWSCN